MTVPPAPWPLGPNRVSRFYRGGALLEAFRGVPDREAADGDRPEDWVGSAVRSWTPPGEPPTDEGLSRIVTAGGEPTIASLLAADPEAVAGPPLAEAAGVTTGVLVKLLDAGIRLPVHAHPTRAFARRRLGSFFGKAEAWIVLATRAIEGQEPPNVRLGFRRDVGREELRRWVDGDDSGDLLAAMHVRPTRAGEVWFVPPRTPHAIGAGVFIVEIQEPTDFSIVLELAGFPITPADATLALGWDVALEAIERRGRTDDEIDALRQRTQVLIRDASLRRESLLGAVAAPFFRAERLTVRGRARPAFEPAYLVGVVTAGAGTVRSGSGVLVVRAGSTFALPAAAVPDLELSADDRRHPLQLIACRPPLPAALDARPTDSEVH
jgi:mannose-6-phosphate isomerase